MATERRYRELIKCCSLYLVVLAFLPLNAAEKEGGKISARFLEDLPRMKKHAFRETKFPGPKKRASRGLNLMHSIEKVPDGEIFTIDSTDNFIGTIIEFRPPRSSIRKSFETVDDELILIEYYHRAQDFAQFQEHLFKDDIISATKLASNLAEKYPEYGHSWTSLGIAKTAAGDYKGAVMSLEKAKQVGADVSAYHAAAMAYTAQGRKEDAEKEIKTAVGLDPKLKALSDDEIHYLIFRRPAVWGAYRSELNREVSSEVIDRAVEVKGLEFENTESPFKGSRQGPETWSPSRDPTLKK